METFRCSAYQSKMVSSADMTSLAMLLISIMSFTYKLKMKAPGYFPVGNTHKFYTDFLTERIRVQADVLRAKNEVDFINLSEVPRTPHISSFSVKRL